MANLPPMVSEIVAVSVVCSVMLATLLMVCGILII